MQRQVAHQRVFHRLLDTPKAFEQEVISCLQNAEKAKREPVYIVEIYTTFKYLRSEKYLQRTSETGGYCKQCNTPFSKHRRMYSTVSTLSTANDNHVENCIAIQKSSIDDFVNVLYELYRDDQILADKEMNRFSLDFRYQNTTSNLQEFMLCSDRFVTNFPVYTVDQQCRVVPKPSVKTLNFD